MEVGYGKMIKIVKCSGYNSSDLEADSVFSLKLTERQIMTDEQTWTNKLLVNASRAKVHVLLWKKPNCTYQASTWG